MLIDQDIGYIVNRAQGMISVNFSQIESPVILDSLDLNPYKGGWEGRIVINSEYIYFSNIQQDYIRQIEYSDPTHLKVVGKYNHAFWAFDLFALNDSIFIADGEHGYHAVNSKMFHIDRIFPIYIKILSILSCFGFTIVIINRLNSRRKRILQ
jgi:hypothetical protein